MIASSSHFPGNRRHICPFTKVSVLVEFNATGFFPAFLVSVCSRGRFSPVAVSLRGRPVRGERVRVAATTSGRFSN